MSEENKLLLIVDPDGYSEEATAALILLVLYDLDFEVYTRRKLFEPVSAFKIDDSTYRAFRMTDPKKPFKVEPYKKRSIIPAGYKSRHNLPRR